MISFTCTVLGGNLEKLHALGPPMTFFIGTRRTRVGAGGHAGKWSEAWTNVRTGAWKTLGEAVVLAVLEVETTRRVTTGRSQT